MDRFNNDTKIFCFILSTRSGGLGINLTGADTVRPLSHPPTHPITLFCFLLYSEPLNHPPTHPPTSPNRSFSTTRTGTPPWTHKHKTGYALPPTHPPTHPPTQSIFLPSTQPTKPMLTVAHSNRLLLLHPPTHFSTTGERTIEQRTSSSLPPTHLFPIHPPTYPPKHRPTASAKPVRFTSTA